MTTLKVTLDINENSTLEFVDSLDGKWFRVEAKDYQGNVIATDIRVSKEDIKRLARAN